MRSKVSIIGTCNVFDEMWRFGFPGVGQIAFGKRAVRSNKHIQYCKLHVAQQPNRFPLQSTG